MRLALIVAVAANGVIGFQNRLPWHLPQDLQYFKEKTLGKPIIMGRKTFESLGRLLPGRTHIVVTRQQDWVAPKDVFVCNDLASAVECAKKIVYENANSDKEAMIIGGSEVYHQGLALADRIYLTKIEAEFEGDAFFPELDSKTWRQIQITNGDAAAKIAHCFLIYDRIV